MSKSEMKRKAIMSEPREFWISGLDKSCSIPAGHIVTVFVTKTNPIPQRPESFLVIEKSAYDELKADAEKLAREIESELISLALGGYTKNGLDKALKEFKAKSGVSDE